ncbi:ADP-ribosylglycohydrolase family protein [bacterium]|nr:ADP-ribosylglycohydrolase family protein [bacterium]
MRVSPCAYVAKSLEEAKELSYKVTKVTHNHEEGIKGAEATTVAIYLAKNGHSKEEIRDYIDKNYYKLDFTLDEIRPSYRFNETCQGTVNVLIEAFTESCSFEDAIRNTISIGGDSDMVAAIAGSIAEAYYGIRNGFITQVLKYLDDNLIKIIKNFKKKFKL